MLTQTLLELFTRDLNLLTEEIRQYKNESNLWKTEGLITNSAGGLCLHLIGNLNHFIGAIIGGTGYVRQRELEFTLTDVPKMELIKQVEDTLDVIDRTLKKLTEADLQKEYELQVFKKPMSTEYFLVHLSTHLSYHLGQINYHRRLLD
ncbi:DinB family protein [Winogradskyella thalassocola]|uniref:DinB superfamily protein n=1 Tax=Winogradskyella thalassocola TaxID=262004 RepID=A0A1G8IZH8_9FLAO|nr:DUF1572 family protein [Winogradskyella thalassocola]SDI24266.1 Protein of unknown function [Winogradskyella thalassocola]